MEFRSSCLCGRYITHWVIPPAYTFVFVNKVLWEHSPVHLPTCCLWLLSTTMAELSNCYRDRPTKLKVFISIFVWEISSCVPDIAVHRSAQRTHWALKAEETLSGAIFHSWLREAQWATPRRWMPSSVHKCVVCSCFSLFGGRGACHPHHFLSKLMTPPPKLRITRLEGSLSHLKALSWGPHSPSEVVRLGMDVYLLSLNAA